MAAWIGTVYEPRVDIAAFDPNTATEADLRQWYALDSAIEREQVGPTAPVMPYAESLAWLQDVRAIRPTYYWVARERETIVGSARLAWWANQSDRNADLMVNVAADRRRQGIGTALLLVAAEAAVAAGRELAGFEVVAEAASGTGFLASLGAELKQRERRSLCRTAYVDRDLLAQWVAAAPTEQYELLIWCGAVPEEWLAELARVKEAINDAPLDELSMGRIDFDVDTLRNVLADAQRREQVPWTCVAVHRESGRIAGETEILVPSRWPEVAYQENTAVDPPHRKLGIGRWIKAALMLELLDARPSTEWVQTWNAASNAGMLAINVAMGFRPAEEWGIWQIPLDPLLTSLKVHR